MAKRLNDMEQELVRRYLDLDLSEPELTAFEKRLVEDSAFANEVRAFEDASDGIEHLIRTQRDEIPITDWKSNAGQGQGIHIDTPVKKITGQKNRKLWFLIPLAAVILLAIGVFTFLPQGSEMDTSAVFAYTEEMSDDLLRSNDVASTFNEDVKKEFGESRTFIDNGKFDDAIEELNGIINTSDNISARELAHWWLATTYFKKGEKDKGKEVLNTIINTPDFNSATKAKKILGK